MTIKIQYEQSTLLRMTNEHNPLHSSSLNYDWGDFDCAETNEAGCEVSTTKDVQLDSIEYRSSSPVCVAELDLGVYEKRVRFADPIIADVRTRPRTPLSEISKLFYSSEETLQFRNDYRSWLDSQRLDNKHEISRDNCESQELSSQANSKRKYGFVARVSVKHGENVYHLQAQDNLINVNAEGNDLFFDDEAFWNGNITWYY